MMLTLFSGFHHSNFLSMSGSWVGKNHNIPQNKFNLLPDIHDRIGQMKFGQKGAPLQYTSLRIGFKMLIAFLSVPTIAPSRECRFENLSQISYLRKFCFIGQKKRSSLD